MNKPDPTLETVEEARKWKPVEERNWKQPRRRKKSGATNGRRSREWTRKSQALHDHKKMILKRYDTWVKKRKNYLVFMMLVQSCCYLQLKIIINIACLWIYRPRVQTSSAGVRDSAGEICSGVKGCSGHDQDDFVGGDHLLLTTTTTLMTIVTLKEHDCASIPMAIKQIGLNDEMGGGDHCTEMVSNWWIGNLRSTEVRLGLLAYLHP